MSNETAHNADLVRRRLTSQMINLRSYISCLPGSTETVDRLRGKDGEKRVARIIDIVCRELGYEIATSVEDASSEVRRAVARVRGSL